MAARTAATREVHLGAGARALSWGGNFLGAETCRVGLSKVTLKLHSYTRALRNPHVKNSRHAIFEKKLRNRGTPPPPPRRNRLRRRLRAALRGTW